MKALLTAIILQASIFSFSQNKLRISDIDTFFTIRRVLDTTSFYDVVAKNKDQSVGVTVFWKHNAIRVIHKQKEKTDTLWFGREDCDWNTELPRNVDTSKFLYMFQPKDYRPSKEAIISQMIRCQIWFDNSWKNFREKLNGFYYQ